MYSGHFFSYGGFDLVNSLLYSTVLQKKTSIDGFSMSICVLKHLHITLKQTFFNVISLSELRKYSVLFSPTTLVPLSQEK